MPSKKGFLQKVKDFFDLPPLDLPSEREEEIIEKLAQYAAKFGIELPALMVGWYLEPVSTILTHTTLLPYVPILEFMGIKASDYMNFFSKKENIKRLMDRIKELEGTYMPRV